MKSRRNSKACASTRDWERLPHLRDLKISYEGHTDTILVRSPDISHRGMFINTPNHFPEGAVLKLQFVLTSTGVEVRTRCEVRYCLPGVGIGVEFIEISPEAREAIQQEVRTGQRRAGKM